ncbi:MAG: tRNA 2-thiouridine(34) synthase MnmA [Verrucomicrobiota bacterium]
MMKKILVAMSGGVDSSVAAALLKEKGYQIAGAYMKNWINEPNIIGNCPWEEDIEDARAVAKQLDIDFDVVNLIKEYQERIVKYLLDGYAQGVTPNPDVMCNREMKFGVFMDYALENGFDAVATGHYSNIRLNKDGTSDILEGADTNKDQSYFLALLQQKQCAHAAFPVGHLLKSQVRQEAQRFNLPNHHKKDSQGICFIGEVKMSDFLKAYLPESHGDIVNLQGQVLGQHNGLHYYTLGQRKGIRIPSNTPNKAYVVVEKRLQSNELVIALEEPDTPLLYASRAILSHLSFTNKDIKSTCKLQARPRYRAPRCDIRYQPLDKSQAEIVFDKPQRALAPGQICALYEDTTLIGGGIFKEIYHSN